MLHVTKLRESSHQLCLLLTNRCDALQATVKDKHRELLKREGIYPLWAHTMAPVFAQIPVWVTMSFALRGLATPEVQPSLSLLKQMAIEGTLWFPNLVVPDVW